LGISGGIAIIINPPGKRGMDGIVVKEELWAKPFYGFLECRVAPGKHIFG
jgi:hypothetical protein